MSRKTVNIETIKGYVNNFCLNSADDESQARGALGTMIENVLMDSGNYKGFSYLSQRDMNIKSTHGVSFGVFVNDKQEHSFEDSNCTSVRYF